jgi:hypothetical protein
VVEVAVAPEFQPELVVPDPDEPAEDVALPLPTAETVARELLQSTAGGALTPPRQRRQRKRDDPRPE